MRLAASAEGKLRPSDPQDEKKQKSIKRRERGKRRKLLVDIKLLIYTYFVSSR
jgi:hypothetical protein